MNEAFTIDNFSRERPAVLDVSSNRYFYGRAIFFFTIVALSCIATLLHFFEITTPLGGYFFAFALLGLRWPSKLLIVFIFFMALWHRDFAYTTINLAQIPLYITEWVLFILAIAALPKARTTISSYPLPVALILAFLLLGFTFLFFTLPSWGPMTALRDFAIVYYSLFALMVLSHIKLRSNYRYIVAAFILGTLPNLLAEMANFLYGTLPFSPSQVNHSLRNSFFYLVALGFCLPFISYGFGKTKGIMAITYLVAVSSIILFYSYSKTAMIALLLMLLLFFIPRITKLPYALTITIVALFITAYNLAPVDKRHPFKTVLTFSTFQNNSRTLLDIATIRDFTEHPYGIGFGASIFGEHSRLMVKNVDGFHSLHNSYLALIRRTGIEGFSIFLLIVYFGLVAGLSTYKKLDQRTLEGKLALGGVFAWLPVSIYCFGHVTLEGPFFGAPYWIIVGSVYGNSLFPKSSIRDRE